MRSKRFLYAAVESRCCRAKTLLVRSRQGGFVSRNCLKCGKPDYVNEQQLPSLHCDYCSRAMVVRKVDGQNYFYVCDNCNRNWQLSEVLPHWDELFEYSGLAVDSDLPLPPPLRNL